LLSLDATRECLEDFAVDTRLRVDCSNDDLLVSWKDIAAYLKCSVRKAQRLERRELPVNRIEGTKSVWASKSEIDRWLISQAEKTKGLQTQFATITASDSAGSGCAEAVTVEQTDEGRLAARISGIAELFSRGWLRLLFGISVGLTVGAAMVSAYGLTIVFFGIAAVFLMLTYRSLRNTSYTRGMVAFFMIAGMSYCASATTLPDVVGSVVNMTALKPALAYPLVTGLRFIPILVLISIFLVVLRNNRGFAHSWRSRAAYLFFGAFFLFGTAGVALTASGAYRLVQASLSIRWTLLAGESFIFGVNLGLFVLGYRFFNTTSIKNYHQFLKSCGTGYLLIALTAAIVGRHWNEINQHHLDTRMPHAYRVQNTDAEKDLRDWLERHSTEAGPDLVSLRSNLEFLHALRTQEFYRHDFDEAFQVSRRAVIFGYKAGRDSLDKRPIFVLIRFPAALAAVLRFELVRN